MFLRNYKHKYSSSNIPIQTDLTPLSQEIADVFGLRHYGGVSSTVHLFMKELQHDPDLREKVSCVVKKLRAQI